MDISPNREIPGTGPITLVRILNFCPTNHASHQCWSEIKKSFHGDFYFGLDVFIFQAIMEEL